MNEMCALYFDNTKRDYYAVTEGKGGGVKPTPKILLVLGFSRVEK